MASLLGLVNYYNLMASLLGGLEVLFLDVTSDAPKTSDAPNNCSF